MLTILKSRKGSQIVEATMVLPVTVMILAALMGLLMNFYINLTEQITNHEKEREELYGFKEVAAVRVKESLLHGAEQAGIS